MSDPTSITDLAITGGTGVGSATVIGFIYKLLLGKQAVEVSTRLAVIEEQLKQLVASVKKHDDLSERVTKLEALCANCKRRR